MKLNGSFFSNVALIVTLLISPTLSVQAKEATNSAQDSSITTSDSGFLSKSATTVKFTFALVAIVGGLIVSDRYQKKPQKQSKDSGESHENTKVVIEERSENQDLTRVN